MAEENDRKKQLEALESLPDELSDALSGLTDPQLDTPYRDGGWTLRQVAHHLADSHMNGFAACRWLLTEERPDLKSYNQDLWAELPDARTVPPEVSVNLLRAIHMRWVTLLRGVGDEAWDKVAIHPRRGESTLSDLLALYAWHGRHHVDQIREMRAKHGW